MGGIAGPWVLWDIAGIATVRNIADIANVRNIADIVHVGNIADIANVGDIGDIANVRHIADGANIRNDWDAGNRGAAQKSRSTGNEADPHLDHLIIKSCNFPLRRQGGTHPPPSRIGRIVRKVDSGDVCDRGNAPAKP